MTSDLLTCAGETKSHALLASRCLAPPLLARFQNGLLYRFIRGQVTTPEELALPAIWRGVAQQLGQWHAVLPVREAAAPTSPDTKGTLGAQQLQMDQDPSAQVGAGFALIEPSQPEPNLWTVIQKWILALPVATEEQRARRVSLQSELLWIVQELEGGNVIGENGVCIRFLPLFSPSSSSCPLLVFFTNDGLARLCPL